MLVSSFSSFLVAALTLGVQVIVASPSCRPESISLSPDALPGASIIDIQAHQIKNRKVEGHANVEDAIIDATCEVLISYIYPNTDTPVINVSIWLPDEWNGRFMGHGGGGWQTSMSETVLILPIKEGFATAQTKGGVTGLPFETDYTLLSPGNPNKASIDRLGYRAIHEMTVLAKQVVEVYYGKPAKTNIYNGCSTGGRQGLMEASRYPEDYDGIFAAAPAVRWSEFIVGGLANQALMAESSYIVSECEADTINKAAVEACDGLDGLVDGVLARPDLCKFHATSVIGKEFKDDCGGGGKVTAIGAKIVQQIVDGIFASNGEKVSAGFPWGTAFASSMGHASTKVDKETGRLTFNAFPVSFQWVNDLLLNGLNPLNYSSLTIDDVQTLVRRSKLEYEYAIEPQPDLSAFKNRGGKVMTFHGIEDEKISVYNSLHKYSEVQQTMFPRDSMAKGIQKMQSFWRLFLVPGVQHCAPQPGKVGPNSESAYQQVLRWVEDGVAPDHLQSYRSNPTYSNMCLWPSKPFWIQGGQLTCQNGLSTRDAYPSISELLIKFIERLPSWLYLEPAKVEL